VTRLRRLPALTLAAVIGPLAFAACASDDTPAAPTRACGITVWHKPASSEAAVEIVGDWDGWKRPGKTPAKRADGWRVAAFEVPPGEHAYAIVEDGVWLTDRNVPMTSLHDGREVALAVAPDCARPIVRVDGVDVSGTDARVRASFLAARGGASLAPASLEATTRDGLALRVASASPESGAFVLESGALAPGKHVVTLRARDRAGVPAEEARATVWVEPSREEPWDPRDAVVYQVFLDRFRNEAGALAPPATPSSRAGGNLAGVRRAIESGEIEALGVNTLWLSPLYKNPEGSFPGNDGRSYTSYHGYWPVASRELDPRFATEAELDAFMTLAHARGLRVLFDVVPNHVHEQHPLTKQHTDWFGAPGCICGQGACDWATNIRTCWFAPYMPDLDWTNAAAARAETDDVLWWMDRWDGDGLRIDAVPMMPRAATRRITNAVRARYEHPGNHPYVLGENFTGPGAYQSLRYDLGPFGLDGSFHFPLMWTLRSVLAEEREPMRAIDLSFRAGEEAWAGAGAVMGLMIGNHDVARFASVSAGNAAGDAWDPPPQPVAPAVYAKQRLALGAVFTLPGAPVLYYGDEVGLAGRSDPDCRRVMPGDEALLPAQRDTRELVRALGKARACSKALRRGDVRTLLADDERFVFARTTASEVAVVVLTRQPSLPAAVSLAGLPGVASATDLVDVVTGAPGVNAPNGGLEVANTPRTVHVYVPKTSRCAVTQP
jgi:glycosidase